MSAGNRRAPRAAKRFLLAVCVAMICATAVEAAGMRVIEPPPPEPPPKTHPHRHIHAAQKPISVRRHAPSATGDSKQATSPADDASAVLQRQEDVQAQRRTGETAERVAGTGDLMARWAIVQMILTIIGGIAIATLFWTNARATKANERATKELQESVRGAREAFLSSQRPLLKVRQFAHVAGAADVDGNLQAMRGSFSIINVGSAPAHVKASRVGFKFLDDPLPAPNGNEGNDFAGTRTFEAGESDRFEIACAAYSPPIGNHSACGGQRTLCIYGSIDYTDGLGRAHTTAFCRRYDVKSQRYRVVDDNDWEYAE